MLIPMLAITILAYGPGQSGTAAPAAAPILLSDLSPIPETESTLDPQLAALRTRGRAGELEAQARLGIIYYLGEGVPVDWGEAQFWLRKAATRGHPAAQVKLAAMCFLGQGMPVDLSQSVDWFRKAADQGEPHAQACLGVMCATGVGVPQDLVEAYVWLVQARLNGVTDGAETLVKVRRLLTREQIEEGNRRALEAVARRSQWQS